jgi:hypothetical protein
MKLALPETAPLLRVGSSLKKKGKDHDKVIQAKSFMPWAEAQTHGKGVPWVNLCSRQKFFEKNMKKVKFITRPPPVGRRGPSLEDLCSSQPPRLDLHLQPHATTTIQPPLLRPVGKTREDRYERDGGGRTWSYRIRRRPFCDSVRVAHNLL